MMSSHLNLLPTERITGPASRLVPWLHSRYVKLQADTYACRPQPRAKGATIPSHQNARTVN